MEKIEYLKSLSKRVCAVGALFFDEHGRILVLETSYKKGWTIPGGVVDEKESLIEALRREVREEVDLAVESERLIVVEYKSGEINGYFSDSLQFIFFGGILNSNDIENIKVDGDEIIGFDFLDKSVALEKLSEGLSKRVECALDNLDSKSVIFMNNGKIESKY